MTTEFLVNSPVSDNLLGHKNLELVRGIYLWAFSICDSTRKGI